jgi:hypothetical protein
MVNASAAQEKARRAMLDTGGMRVLQMLLFLLLLLQQSSFNENIKDVVLLIAGTLSL